MSGRLVERGLNEVEVLVGSYVATGRAGLTNDAGAWECWSSEYGFGYGNRYYHQS